MKENYVAPTEAATEKPIESKVNKMPIRIVHLPSQNPSR
jgi:hypothetical protein